jgi:hypothetical protein
MGGYKLLTYLAGAEARAGILVGGEVYDAAKSAGVPSSVLAILQAGPGASSWRRPPSAWRAPGAGRRACRWAG